MSDTAMPINLTGNIIYVILLLGIGGVCGWSVRDYFCPDINNAVVDQIADDGKELAKAREKIIHLKGERDEIKRKLLSQPADPEFLDAPYPDEYKHGMFDAFNATGSKTD